MFRMKFSTFTAIATLALSSLGAQASLLSVVGGTAQDVPNTAPSLNNFVSTLPAGQKFNVGGNLKANVSLYVEYYFLGNESFADSSFIVGNEYISSKEQDAFLKCTGGGCDSTIPKNKLPQPYVVPSISSTVGMGQLLDFSFSTKLSSKVTLTLANGHNTTDLSKYGFATAINTSFHGKAYDAILFLDDTGKIVYNGKSVDDNDFDDLMIGVKVRAVPEPATLLLVGLGLIGLAGARRFKR
jgi:hypothetical protein